MLYPVPAEVEVATHLYESPSLATAALKIARGPYWKSTQLLLEAACRCHFSVTVELSVAVAAAVKTTASASTASWGCGWLEKVMLLEDGGLVPVLPADGITRFRA